MKTLGPRAALVVGLVTLVASPALAQNEGCLTGLRGFESFHEPIGQPIYFETPFNDTGLRALYLRHEFSDQSVMAGGDLTIYALQARVALTEKLQFIATKDGYSDLDSGLVKDEGWNDIAFGFKYVLLADKEEDVVVSTGLRYMAENGHRGILQGGVDEFSPFVSAAKGWDRLHLLGSTTLRVPTDGDDGNTVLHWDAHLDYDVNPGAETVFAPTVELHGVHYLDDGATALPVGGLDYANLGSQPKEDFVAWAGVGTRVEFGTKWEAGIVYEFAVTDPDDDIMESRITIDFLWRW